MIRKKLTTNEFIKKAIITHGDKYNYSLVEYKNNKTKIKIWCYSHGEFEQIPLNHLVGRGCPKCAGKTRLTTEQFIDKAKEIHGNRYGYSFVEYKNNKLKIKIECFIHGVFEQTPTRHLRGQGCNRCYIENIKK